MGTCTEEIAELEVHLRHQGERALFIAETGTRAAARELTGYFAAMPCETRLIAIGPVVVCAARVREGEPSPFDAMAQHLRDRYALSICEPGFTPSMYRVALQLARDSEGEVHPLGCCALCGAVDPFPTLLRVVAGASLLAAEVCQACVRATGEESGAAICRRLLAKLGEPFAAWQDVPLAGPREGEVWWATVARPALALAVGADRREG